MNVAAVQLVARDSPEANLEQVERRVRSAAENGAEVVVLPEMWNVGYFAFDRYDAAAEPLDGPTMRRLEALADELGIFLHTGSIVERDGEDRYNTSALLSPSGDRLGTYRKVHLFGYESEEATLLTPGESLCAIETAFGTVGLTTCYDLRFPALYRALVDEGVEMLLVTSAWPQARIEHWHALTRTRAIESQVYLVAANLAGENRGVELGGQSVVVDPWGVQRANAGEGPSTVHADLSLDEVRSVRESFPILEDRRLSATYEFVGSDGHDG
jgi:predicted amidohydrolase